MKLRIKSMIWNIRKQRHLIRTARRKKNKKNDNKVRSLWDNSRCTNIGIIGMPEGEEKEQEIGNLFEKIMKENFPNYRHASPESPESQTSWTQRGPHQDTL